MHQDQVRAIAPISLVTISATLLLSSCIRDRSMVENPIPRSTPSITLAQTQAKTKGATNLSALEQGIVAQTNRARTNPTAYATELQNMRKYYKGNLLELPGKTPIITQEGVKAVDEAIRSLKSTKPAPVLSVSRGLSLAAKDHVKDQGPKGTIGHNGSDGSLPWDRINRYGSWRTVVGENISYGPNTAQQVVMQLIIDDGVADRGHRKNLFNPQYRVTGVACGSHKQYRVMCDITYAGSFKEGSVK